MFNVRLEINNIDLVSPICIGSTSPIHDYEHSIRENTGLQRLVMVLIVLLVLVVPYLLWFKRAIVSRGQTTLLFYIRATEKAI